ncbi:hypothetical protein AGOR_G00242220 [Albula goreensis]|uniref:Uncharacterized protein n=1 Tax=Albula goreensis TaxID=1534307 RepID=A0A8T3CEQ3_9TELE|nr:hypothetical protein AGOR_G00242220 [Albula goreensis]
MAVALDAVWVRVKNVCKQNGLLILSVLAVIIGCLLGFFLRARHLSEQHPPVSRFHGAELDGEMAVEQRVSCLLGRGIRLLLSQGSAACC